MSTHGEWIDRVFASPRSDVPIEVTTLEVLKRKGSSVMKKPGRVSFHVVIICTEGSGTHEVDFSRVRIKPHRVVHVRPGQVHRWHLSSPYQATLVLFEDSAAGIKWPGFPEGPTYFDLDPVQWKHSHAALDILWFEQEADREVERRRRAMVSALALLIVNLGLDLPHDTRHFSRAITVSRINESTRERYVLVTVDLRPCTTSGILTSYTDQGMQGRNRAHGEGSDRLQSSSRGSSPLGRPGTVYRVGRSRVGVQRGY